MEYLINIDIGGTHTDGVAIRGDGEIIEGKVSSTPDDFSRGFFDSLARMADELDMNVDALLDETSLISHGTTVGTNAVLEDEGANTALVTTKAAESTLSIMRGGKGLSDGLSVEEYLNVHEVSKPKPLVDPDQVFGINERIDCMGDVIVEFDDAQATNVAKEISDLGAESVAISFLWSFLNGDHEREMAAVLREELGDDVYVTTSSELVPVWGEYERTAATAINALIGPEVSSYIDRIDRELTERGYDGPLLVMQVGGGVFPAKEATRKPVMTIDSGPAAGITGCEYLADLLGQENVIAADMGGTSFDVGLITDGDAITNSTNVLRQYEYVVRNIDVESIGSGGGSIAWHDEDVDRLRVGPKSAGADPGPACYGRGGTRPTVTDADLVCGFLDPDLFLGGQMTLDEDSARSAIDSLADRMDMDPDDIVRGILQISTAKMADLIRRQTIYSGLDPREFVIYAYGGAGPLHVPLIARELNIQKVVVPLGNVSSVWSALGISSTDVLHRNERSNTRRNAPFDPEELTREFEEMEEEVLEKFEDEGLQTDIQIRRFANVKYGLQVHSLSVPVPSGTLTEEDMSDLVERFETLYEQRYGEGSGASETGFAITSLRVDGYGETPKPQLGKTAKSDASASGSPLTESILWPSEQGADRIESSIYYSDMTDDGATIDGPSVIRLQNTTIAVPPSGSAYKDRYGNYVIEFE